MNSISKDLVDRLDSIIAAAKECPEVSHADYLLIEAVVTLASICSVNGVVLNKIMKELRKGK